MRARFWRLWPRRRAREGLRDGVESAIRRSAISPGRWAYALSAWFQLALSLLAAAVSVYSFGYLRKMEGLTQSRNSRLLVQRDAAQPHAGIRRWERPSFSFWRGDLRSTYANFFGISRRFGRGGEIRAPDPLRPRERNRFQAVYRVSRIPNGYNNPGNLLSLKEQLRWTERIGFGNSFGTVKKQGRV